MRKRTTTTATTTTAAGAMRTAPEDGATEHFSGSRASSVVSAPSTIAESLRSYWESRRGTPRRTGGGNAGGGGGPLLRNIYRSHQPPAAAQDQPYGHHHQYRVTASSRLGPGAKRPFIGCSAKVDASVSRLVSLVLRDFVQDWYEKITDDTEFAADVSAQIALVTRELERRCRAVDWVRFVLFELPEIIHLHVRDAQQCTARLGTVYAGGGTSIEAMFQSMQPHVALARAANSELSYLRHLARDLLLVLLPPEAQTDEAVNHLLREIVACAVLRNAVDAIADPNTLNEAIIKAVGRYSRREYFSKADMSRYSTMPLGIDDDNDVDANVDGGEVGADLDPARPAKTVTVEAMLHEAQTTQLNEEEEEDDDDGILKETSPAAGSRNRQKVPTTFSGRRRSATMKEKSNNPTFQEKPDGTAAAASADQKMKVTSVSKPPLAADAGTITTTTSSGVWERLSSQLSFSSLWLIRDLFSQVRWRGWKNNTIRGMVYLHLIVTQTISRMVSMFSEYTFSLNQLWQSETPQASYRGAFEPFLGLLNAALLLDRYNQWVWTQFLFYIYPLINILAGAAIDRTLVNVVSFLISDHQIASYVDTLAAELWRPEDGGRFRGRDKRRPYKTLHQQELLKTDTAELVAELLPYVAVRFFYGLSDEERLLAAQRILEPFENRQLNKHLVYNILDSIVGKIAPELQDAA
ncbi:hypothetical protein H4217_005014 [Coemansia sp. RSA 1939]|nr:hypothetical protein H4217_005014 [Coemansia sp. RSA 1939]KAJ2611185.1 hypothetical protein EV177_003610 [Coemansia sp. RSA 1804]